MLLKLTIILLNLIFTMCLQFRKHTSICIACHICSPALTSEYLFLIISRLLLFNKPRQMHWLKTTTINMLTVPWRRPHWVIPLLVLTELALVRMTDPRFSDSKEALLARLSSLEKSISDGSLCIKTSTEETKEIKGKLYLIQ